MSAKKELHFYPGEKRLVLLEGSRVLVSAEAWGGPEHVILHKNAMAQGPTDAGRFVIGWVGKYHTGSWPWSKIQWGTALRDISTDVYFENSSGTWSSIKKDFGITRDAIIKQHYALYGKKNVPPTWIFNDFGPQAIRYYVDSNRNGKQDKSENLSGEMFHTTPDNEAQQARGQSLHMTESHGCIHMKPLERDTLKNKGAFDLGRTLIIHSYTDRFKHP